MDLTKLDNTGVANLYSLCSQGIVDSELPLAKSKFFSTEILNDGKVMCVKSDITEPQFLRVAIPNPDDEYPVLNSIKIFYGSELAHIFPKWLISHLLEVNKTL